MYVLLCGQMKTDAKTNYELGIYVVRELTSDRWGGGEGERKRETYD